MKKMVWEENGSLSVNYEYAETIITELQKHINTFGKRNVRIEEQTYAYSDRPYFAVMIQRLETDAEEQKREAMEAKQKADQDARDRETFEELRKKFE